MHDEREKDQQTERKRRNVRGEGQERIRGDISPRKNSLGICAERKPREKKTGRIIREKCTTSSSHSVAFIKNAASRNLNCESKKKKKKGKILLSISGLSDAVKINSK